VLSPETYCLSGVKGMKQAKFETQAQKMAERMDHARQVGEQLSFLADPDGEGGEAVPAERKAGRPKGSKNKVESQMRAMLAAKGMRMPEDVMAEIAGLSSREDVKLQAMADTEMLLSWAAAGAAKLGKKGSKTDWKASGGQRMSVFFEFYKLRIKALEALLPYGLGKVTPDVSVSNTQVTQIVMPGGGEGASATLIEGRDSGRMAPPPLPNNMQQNQEVSEVEAVAQESAGRTE
jgi:hypothetical protein